MAIGAGLLSLTTNDRDDREGQSLYQCSDFYSGSCSGGLRPYVAILKKSGGGDEQAATGETVK